MQIFWKKRGHSRVLGRDKDLNDLADSLAKQGATDGKPWQFDPDLLPNPPSHSVAAVTRSQTLPSAGPADAGPSVASVAPAFTDADLQSLQAHDPAIRRMLLLLSDAPATALSPDDLDLIPGFRHLYNARPFLRIVNGLLVHVSDTLTSPAFVVPQSHRGVMLEPRQHTMHCDK